MLVESVTSLRQTCIKQSIACDKPCLDVGQSPSPLTLGDVAFGNFKSGELNFLVACCEFEI